MAQWALGTLNNVGHFVAGRGIHHGIWRLRNMVAGVFGVLVENMFQRRQAIAKSLS